MKPLINNSESEKLHLRFVFYMKPCLIIGFLCLYFQGFTQVVPDSLVIPDSLKKTVDSLVRAAPAGFSKIHSVLRGSRRDTVLMRYFADASAKRKYTDGQAYALK